MLPGQNRSNFVFRYGFSTLATIPTAKSGFKKTLSSDEKQELMEKIREYKDGFIPLIVPVTLISHYVRKCDEPYLKSQTYLNPHPVELKLRNHV